MTAGYKNGTITQPVITTFRVFFFWTLFPPRLFFFFVAPPLYDIRSGALSGVSPRGVCVVTLASFSPDFPRSRLNTTLPSSEQCLTRRAGECVWPALRKMMPTLQQKRLQPGEGKKSWKVGSRARGSGAERTVTGGCEENCTGYEDSIGRQGQRKGVTQHVRCLYGGSLNRLIALSFSRLGCLNVSDHPNSSSVKYICIYVYQIHIPLIIGQVANPFFNFVSTQSVLLFEKFLMLELK